jgi:hypothetical protein
MSLTIVVVLALAANTSFGGLPVLASLLAQNNCIPHLYALRDDRQVFASGIWTLEDQPTEPADLRMCRPAQPETMTVTC